MAHVTPSNPTRLEGLRRLEAAGFNNSKMRFRLGTVLDSRVEAHHKPRAFL